MCEDCIWNQAHEFPPANPSWARVRQAALHTRGHEEVWSPALGESDSDKFTSSPDTGSFLQIRHRGFHQAWWDSGLKKCRLRQHKSFSRKRGRLCIFSFRTEVGVQRRAAPGGKVTRVASRWVSAWVSHSQWGLSTPCHSPGPSPGSHKRDSFTFWRILWHLEALQWPNTVPETKAFCYAEVLRRELCSCLQLT